MTVYRKGDIELRLGDYRDVLADVEPDAVITDPPYSERTHSKQTHGRKKAAYSPDACLTARGLEYGSWSEQDIAAFVGRWARTRGWVAVFHDHTMRASYEALLVEARRYVFAPLACVQTGMNVRLAGDGPSNWTCWLTVSRLSTLRHWGTLRGAYWVGQDQDRKRAHTVCGGKPLGLMRQVVRDYSRPRDLVCDPCAGGATTLIAAAMEGRRAIGAELDPATYELACKRIARTAITPPLFVDERPRAEQIGLLE